jgi:RNA polymerase sigma-70 factor (ECF subfamily)
VNDVAATDPAAVFEAARARLIGRAYRLLGVLADADDVVQDAWLRWERADRSAIGNPDAWLNTTVTRLALDRLRARKREEERYVGPWLPTPLVERTVDPSQSAELSDSLATAFLIMLERLTPEERAAFLLADVFGERFDEIAAAMDRSVESCRQLASRARRKVRATHEARRDEQRQAAAVTERFLVALATGDAATAVACLAPDAVYLSDGGPDRHAARRPVRVPERIVRLLANVYRRFPTDHEIVPARVGGSPGLVVGDGRRTVYTLACEVVDGRIVRITTVLNPDKLHALDRSITAID